MLVSKRQFLRMSLGGSAAVFLAPFLRCPSLLGSPVILSPNFLQSSVYSHWMMLSHGDGSESRQTRRNLGVALRHLGAIRGKGRGYEFTLIFDEAVETLFRRWVVLRRKPGSLFGLIQMIYDDFIFPTKGAEAGRILFSTLFSILRGRDGSVAGEAAYRNYLAFRSASLAYKNAYRTGDITAIAETRKNRSAQLTMWRSSLGTLSEGYALRRTSLKINVPVQTPMLKGFELYRAPVQISAPELVITPLGDQVVVSWKGDARLQQASNLNGPWSEARKSTPAGFNPLGTELFFRTIKTTTKSP
jgi:hypothetical protein